MPGVHLGKAQSFSFWQEQSSPDSSSSLPPTGQGNQQIHCLAIAWELQRSSIRAGTKQPRFQAFSSTKETRKPADPGDQWNQCSRGPFKLGPEYGTAFQCMRIAWEMHTASTPGGSRSAQIPGLFSTYKTWKPTDPGVQGTSCSGGPSKTGPVSSSEVQRLRITWELHRTSHSGRSQARQFPGVLFHHRIQEPSRPSTCVYPVNCTELTILAGAEQPILHVFSSTKIQKITEARGQAGPIGPSTTGPASGSAFQCLGIA